MQEPLDCYVIPLTLPGNLPSHLEILSTGPDILHNPVFKANHYQTLHSHHQLALYMPA